MAGRVGFLSEKIGTSIDCTAFILLTLRRPFFLKVLWGLPKIPNHGNKLVHFYSALRAHLRESDFFFSANDCIDFSFVFSHRYLTWHFLLYGNLDKVILIKVVGVKVPLRECRIDNRLPKRFFFPFSFTSAAAVSVEMWNPFFFIYDWRFLKR